jgi:hypothetical protein
MTREGHLLEATKKQASGRRCYEKAREELEKGHPVISSIYMDFAGVNYKLARYELYRAMGMNHYEATTLAHSRFGR